MNKADLLKHVKTAMDAQSVVMTAGQVENVVNAVLEGVEGALAEGEDVRLQGFGTFEARERKARTGRNPQTGAEVEIAAHKTVTFRPGKALKELLNA